MNSESKNEEPGNTAATAAIESGGSGYAAVEKQPGGAPQPVASAFVDPAKRRREKIERTKAKLQRDIARDNAARRKERDAQLFVWGAMVEGVYRYGNAQEREQLRQWARRKLTDHRHLKRAECGFARIEDEATEAANA